jgi:Ca2+/Na+ antiporter
MIDEELKRIWQGASEEARIQFNQSRLLIEMEQKLKRFDDTIKHRNYMEIFVAILLIPVFTAIGYFTPYPISRLGAGLIILYCFLVIFKLLHTRRQKNKIDYTTTLKQQLITAKIYIEHEKRLLNTVLYWYLLPPFAGCILFWAGMPMNPWMLGFLILFAILVNGYIWWLNKRAVKTGMNPLIEQIDATLKELEAS